jgi:molybdopterin synthase catalytic subunit
MPPPHLTIVVTPDRLEDASPAWTDTVRSPAAGAVASFVGTTRDTFQGRPTLRLEYEAYVPMAEAELKVKEERGNRAFWLLLMETQKTHPPPPPFSSSASPPPPQPHTTCWPSP